MVVSTTLRVDGGLAARERTMLGDVHAPASRLAPVAVDDDAWVSGS